MTGRMIAVVLIFLGTACAQFSSQSMDVVRRLRVRVSFGGHERCDGSVRVALRGVMGVALGEQRVDGDCTAEFSDVPPGRYSVSVSGSDATNADDGDIEVNPAINQDIEVRARHTDDSNPNRWASHAAFVSVTELGMPANAAKEFGKANREIAKEDWKKALEHLSKGLAIYPKYAGAYNNIGAVYSHLGEDAKAKAALEQAVTLDDHLAPAYVNLGRLSFLDKDYASAETLLTKAVSLETTINSEEIFLLAYSQLSDRHLEEAVATSRKGHAGNLNHHAPMHLVAANAYEQEGKISESISELQFYLNEEPANFRAEQVRIAMAKLQAQLTAQLRHP